LSPAGSPFDLSSRLWVENNAGTSGLVGVCWDFSFVEVAEVGFDSFSLEGATTGFASSFLGATGICLYSPFFGDTMDAGGTSSSLVCLDPSSPDGFVTAGLSSSTLEVVGDGLGADSVPPFVVEEEERGRNGVGGDKMGTGALVADGRGELNESETAVVIRSSLSSGEVTKFDPFAECVWFRSLESAGVGSGDNLGDIVEAGSGFFEMTGLGLTSAVSSISSFLEAVGIGLSSRVSRRLVNT